MRKRIIPILLIYKDRLVKTINFNKKIYLGDPINAVRIFNKFKADEIIILDIGVRSNEPSSKKIIFAIFEEAFMPVSYGGGMGTLYKDEEILKNGAEKVIFNSSIFHHRNKVLETIAKVGSQSVLVSVDLKFDYNVSDYFIFNPNYTIKQPYLDALLELDKLNFGEILINFVNNDGIMKGYDFEALFKINEKLNTPTIACGGAKNLIDMVNVINKSNCNAAAASSIFLFKNKDYDSIMINYPTQLQLNSLFE